jgi:ferrous iron transport protein A
MLDLIPLNRLRSGETAAIVEIVGRSDQVQRIKELGLHDGVELTMVRAGSPCIIRVAGQTLCIRANELLNVLVRPAVPA